MQRLVMKCHRFSFRGANTNQFGWKESDGRLNNARRKGREEKGGNENIEEGAGLVESGAYAVPGGHRDKS